MSTRKAPQTDVELINAFGELFDEVEIESVEEANAILKSAGYDPDATARRLLSAIDQALASSPMNWRNQQQQMAKARERMNSMRKWRYTSKADLEAAVQELLSLVPRSQAVVAHYRSFQELAAEDLDTWLDELAFLVDTSETDK
ncbi:MAG: hypothetical protein U0X20_25990 [Caldilineaceae bacterium]